MLKSFIEWPLWRLVIFLTGFSFCGIERSQADVWEYGAQGEVLLSPDMSGANGNVARMQSSPRIGQGASSEPVRSEPGHTDYAAMTQAVALQYATRRGVRQAGLSSRDFVALFTALIDQESRFNPRAVSPKGARGLGQLMPDTARQLGVSDPFEPQANLHGAARYFVAQLERFGRADLALAAYNAGPHRVEQFNGIPPFRETRTYVARITAAARLPAATPRRFSAASSSTSNQRTVLEWIN